MQQEEVNAQSLPPKPALMVVKAVVSTFTGVNATCLQSSPQHWWNRSNQDQTDANQTGGRQFRMITAFVENGLLQWMWRANIWNKVFTVFFFFSKDPSVIWGGGVLVLASISLFCMRGTSEHRLFNWTHPNHIWRLPGGAKPPEGTMFVYHSVDSLHRHIRSPECFIVPRKANWHSSRVRNHTIRRHPLSAADVEVFSDCSVKQTEVAPWCWSGRSASADAVVL